MKKLIPLVVIIIVGIAGLLLFIFRGQKSKTSESETVPANIIEVPMEKRPYVTLKPRNDGHGVILRIENIKSAEALEYQFLYLAKDGEGNEFTRGFSGGPVKLEGATSFERGIKKNEELLFGSCSRNVCKYDEGVSEGTLTLKLEGASGIQKYEIVVRLQKGSEAKDGLTSPDGKFTFTGIMPASSFYLIQETVGLPKMPSGKIVGGPYGIFTSGAKNISGVVKIRLSEVSPSVKVYGWDSAISSWKQYTKGFETDGQIVDVEVDRLTIFVVVTP